MLTRSDLAEHEALCGPVMSATDMSSLVSERGTGRLGSVIPRRAIEILGETSADNYDRIGVKPRCSLLVIGQAPLKRSGWTRLLNLVDAFTTRHRRLDPHVLPAGIQNLRAAYD